ncbi:hypothetical protein BJY01DRAFT_174837 [Aspergillus pseudoustus]|uniref:Uncharacterized protein n=1 Tax=Aspergillus pseudoustus TaxID=1810923 RepID=A0ABR4K330_9EURO
MIRQRKVPEWIVALRKMGAALVTRFEDSPVISCESYYFPPFKVLTGFDYSRSRVPHIDAVSARIPDLTPLQSSGLQAYLSRAVIHKVRSGGPSLSKWRSSAAWRPIRTEFRDPAFYIPTRIPALFDLEQAQQTSDCPGWSVRSSIYLYHSY